MIWRRAIGLLGGLLLIVPLALLLGSLSSGWLRPAPPSPELSPVLSPEQRRQLTTYRHACRTNTDCEPPLACLLDTRIDRQRCFDSECESDAGCPANYTCQALSTEGPRGKPAVRLCVPHGTQAEGQPCSPLPDLKQNACQPGLLCYGWCARPCQPKQPACPAGSTCLEGLRGAACMSQCQEGTCPPGQRCRQVTPGISTCAIVHGPPCDLEPCPQGRQCAIWHGMGGATVEVWMQCLPPCGEARSSCPEGSACYDGFCYRPCQPDTQDACGPDARCIFYRERWLCAPSG